LRQADIGVAMGRAGTEAAREAADVVLTDDDFSTIIAAVREGRVIADNVRKVSAFLLSANLGEVVLFALAISAGIGVPMSVIQVLLVNLLTDGLPAIALARDPASAETMLPREPVGGPLFSRKLWVGLGAIGMTVGLAALTAYLVGRAESSQTGQTMAFGTVALAELALVFSFRSERVPLWRLPANPLLALVCMVSAAIVALLVYLPAAHAVAGTASVSVVQAGIVVILALVPGVCAEVAKGLGHAPPERRG
jgi:Ca2+-transporting ATPase